MVVNDMFLMTVILIRVRKKLWKRQEVLGTGSALYLVILLKQIHSFAIFLNSSMSFASEWLLNKFLDGLSRGAQAGVSMFCKSDVWKASILYI